MAELPDLKRYVSCQSVVTATSLHFTYSQVTRRGNTHSRQSYAEGIVGGIVRTDTRGEEGNVTNKQHTQEVESGT